MRFKLAKIKRSFRFFWQRRTRGWDDSETWGLDWTIAKFVLPRLIRFKELTRGYPPKLTWEEWNGILDDMIYAMDVIAREAFWADDSDSVDWPRVHRGCELFGKYFSALWW